MKTAMQEMFEELYAHSFEIPIGLLAKCEELMEKEKEQIKKAVTYTIEAEYYRQTWDNCASVGACADDYYNETYGNPDQV